MAINYCTIGSMTVDGFCGTQRAKVLARLIHEAGHDIVTPPVQPTKPGTSGGISYGPGPYAPPVRPNVPNQWANVRPPQYRPSELDRPVLPIEQPFITVSAEIWALRGSETVEVTPRLDFVTVTDLEFNFDLVTITDLEFNHESVITVNISQMEI